MRPAAILCVQLSRTWAKLQATFDLTEGPEGRNEYTVLGRPGVQRHIVWRAAVSRRQRPVVDFRRHADRQSFPWRLFSMGRLHRAVGDPRHRIMGLVDTNR